MAGKTPKDDLSDVEAALRDEYGSNDAVQWTDAPASAIVEVREQSQKPRRRAARLGVAAVGGYLLGRKIGSL